MAQRKSQGMCSYAHVPHEAWFLRHPQAHCLCPMARPMCTAALGRGGGLSSHLPHARTAHVPMLHDTRAQNLIPEAKPDNGPLFKGTKPATRGYGGNASGLRNGEGYRDPHISLPSEHREWGAGCVGVLLVGRPVGGVLWCPWQGGQKQVRQSQCPQ